MLLLLNQKNNFSILVILLVLAITPITNSQVDLLPDLICDQNQLYDREIDTSIIAGRKHLRLSVGAANIGLGHLELRGETGDFPIDVVQRIYRSDGSFWERLAGQFDYHPTHEHIHFSDWAVYNIREILPYDSVGQVVASGGKVTFCIVDWILYDNTLPNFEGALYNGCGSLLQGLSVGYMDVYSKELPDQWIDITDLLPSAYWLEAVIDPSDSILEADESNNNAMIKIDLCESTNYLIPADDSLIFERVEAPPFTQIRIDISAKNLLQLREITIPINWSGDVDLEFESISTLGHRTEYFEVVEISVKDYNNNRAAFQLQPSLDDSQPDLPPGNGTILSVYFSTGLGNIGDSTQILTTSVNGKFLEFGTACYGFEPDLISGVVTISCCNDTRGNIDGDFLNEVNISDLTYLVDFMFKEGPPISCEKEADLNGSNTIDIADLTYFVNYFFKSGPAPLPCSDL